MECISSFDILSLTPKIKVKSKNRFTTNIGIFLGFCILVFLGIVSIISFTDVLNRTNINILYNLDSRSETLIDFTDNQIILIISDAMGKEFENSEKLFNIQAKFWNVTFPRLNGTLQTQPFGQISNITVKKCSELKPYKQFKEYYDNKINLFKTSLCADFDSLNLTLFGKYGDLNGYSFLNFYINKCVNSTNVQNCSSQEIIDKKLSQIFLSVLSIDNDINSKNLNSPIESFPKVDLLPFSSSIFKNYNVDINSIKLSSDNGLLIRDNHNHISYRTDRISESVDLRGINTLFPGTFGQVNYRSSGKIELINRSYMKFQNVFASLGGIFQFILIIGKLLVYMWSKNNMHEFIFNELFDDNKINKIEIPIQTHLDKIINQMSSPKMKNKNKKLFININDNLDIDKKCVLKKEENQIRFKFYEINEKNINDINVSDNPLKNNNNFNRQIYSDKIISKK